MGIYKGDKPLSPLTGLPWHILQAHQLRGEDWRVRGHEAGSVSPPSRFQNNTF